MPVHLLRVLGAILVVGPLCALPACTQCSEGETREGNQCVRPCNVDGDCAGGMICQEGRCATGQRMTGGGSSGVVGSSSAAPASSSLTGVSSSATGSSAVSATSNTGSSASRATSRASSNASSGSTSTSAGPGSSSAVATGTSSPPVSSGSATQFSSSSAVVSSSRPASSSSSATLRAITALNPPSVLQYQPDAEVVIQGTGFQAGDQVLILNGTLTPTAVTPTSVTFVLSTNDVESAGPLDVRVGGASGTSNAMPLTVRPSPARRDWYVGDAFRDPGTGAEAFLYVFNPTGRNASVTVDAVSTNGSTPYNLMAPSMTLVRATLDTLPTGANHSYHLTASEPVVIFAKSWVPGQDASSATSGAAQGSLLHIFPAGEAGNGVETRLEIGNLGDTAVQFTARAFPGGGNVTLPLAARSHLSLAMGMGTFWQRVTALGPLVIEQVVTGPGFRRSVTGVSQAYPHAYLAYGTASGPRTTRLHLANPGEGSSVAVRTTYHPVNGVDVVFNDTLPPLEQLTRVAAFDLTNGGPFWLEVDAPNGGEFVATATVMDPLGNMDGCAINLQPTPAVDLMVSGGNSLNGWITFLALTNPGDTIANATVTMVFEGGGNYQVDVSVPARGIHVVDQMAVMRQGFYAMQVTSDLPLVGQMVSGTGDMLSGVEVVTP